MYTSKQIRHVHNKVDYDEQLLGVTTSDERERWIIFMLEAVQETSKWTTDKIAAVRKLPEVATNNLITIDDTHIRYLRGAGYTHYYT